MSRKRYKFTFDDRKEFDEVFIQNATVHIERMDEKAFWIGISSPGFMDLMINTGVDSEAIWYFTVEEDDLKGKFYKINRKLKP